MVRLSAYFSIAMATRRGLRAWEDQRTYFLRPSRALLIGV